MKKLLLLLFIPLFSYSQTYKDIMSISSAEMFKKVAIENNYEIDNSNEGELITYGFNIQRDSIEGNKSTKWLSYDPKDDSFFFQFSRSSFLGVNDKSDYDLILNEVKEKCSYHKIVNFGGIDYVTYSCPESSYKGKIGFVIEEDNGIIVHFPDK